MFSLSDVLPGGAIDYTNGQFSGFDVTIDFYSQGKEYQFIERGKSFEVDLFQNGQLTGIVVASGSIDFSPNSLFDTQPFDPSSGENPPGNNPPGNNPPGSNLPGSNPPGNDPPPQGSNPQTVPETNTWWVPVMALAVLLVVHLRSRRRANH